MKEITIWVFVLVGIIALMGILQHANRVEVTTKPEIVIYENCEYLVSLSYMGYYSMTHKGNCKNVEHKK